jgi:D-alanine-D-alanine ligase
MGKSAAPGKNVILAFNLIHEEDYRDQPVDTMAELDTEETISAVKQAIESGGRRVRLVEADEKAWENLKKNRFWADLVFNLAEGIRMDGIRGESRESYIPCLLETLGLPYVGSGPLTLAIALNKYRTKQLLACHGIPTAPFQVFHPETGADAPLEPDLRFPLIAKLACQGSCIGLSYDNIVADEKSLRAKILSLFATYHEAVLVEEFLDGREFTIPVLGNNPPQTLPIVEVEFFGAKPINVFFPDKDFAVFREIGYTAPEQQTRSVCPAEIPAGLAVELNRIALAAYGALECRDFCRLEIRLDKAGNPFVLELNPIPGIAPGFWFPRSAAAAGLDYNALINRILDIALERHGLIPPRPR